MTKNGSANDAFPYCPHALMETMMTAKSLKTTTAQDQTAETGPAPTATTSAAPAQVLALPQSKPIEVVPTASASLVHQERTKLVTLPTTVFLEADPAGFKKSKGHQIDPSRPPSCIPVMPNEAMLMATGNPYPAAPDDTVKASDARWADYVKIGHHVYAVLIEKGEVRGRDPAIVKKILEKAGMKPDTPYAETAVSDALRDLALCGHAVQLMVGRSRLFRVRAAA